MKQLNWWNYNLDILFELSTKNVFFWQVFEEILCEKWNTPEAMKILKELNVATSFSSKANEIRQKYQDEWKSFDKLSDDELSIIKSYLQMWLNSYIAIKDWVWNRYYIEFMQDEKNIEWLTQKSFSQPCLSEYITPYVKLLNWVF